MIIELNIRFQEKYKSLDALCKDIFKSNEGVTRYINEMEATPYQYRRFAYNWDMIYKQLKHMRWVRNQLAHEIGAFEYNLCDSTDIEWLDKFYNSILKTNDPLSVVRRAVYESQKQQQNSKISNNYNTSTPQDKPKKSFWNKIKTKIINWFS